MMVFKIGDNDISIYDNGEIFVNNQFTNIKCWDNELKYSNSQGREQKNLRDLRIEEALYVRGFISKRDLRATSKREKELEKMIVIQKRIEESQKIRKKNSTSHSTSFSRGNKKAAIIRGFYVF